MINKILMLKHMSHHNEMEAKLEANRFITTWFCEDKIFVISLIHSLGQKLLIQLDLPKIRFVFIYHQQDSNIHVLTDSTLCHLHLLNA